MHALTIRQPWADAIVHGTKRTENRTWPAPERHIGTRILLHAAKATDPLARFIIDREVQDNWADVRGALLATAVLAGCHRADGCCGPWGERNVWHWRLYGVTPLPRPVPCTGRLGLWPPDSHTLLTIPREALHRA